MKNFGLLLTLLLGLFQPVFSQDKVDSISILVRSALKQSNDREKVELMVKASELYYNEIYNSRDFSYKTALLADSLNFPDLQARSLIKYIEALNFCGTYPKSDSAFYIAEPILSKAGDSARLAELLIHKSVTDRRKLDFESSRRRINKALELVNKKKHSRVFIFALIQKGHLQYSLSDYKGAMRLYQKSFDLAESIEDYSSMGFAKLSLTQLSHKTLKNTEEIEKGYLKSLAFSRVSNDCILKGIVCLNLVNFYTANKKYDLALSYIDSTAINNECQARPVKDISVYQSRRRGIIYYKKGDFKESLKQFRKDFLDRTTTIYNGDTSYKPIEEVPLAQLKNYPTSMMYISKCHLKLNNIDSSLKWAYDLLKVVEILNYNRDKANTYGILSNAYRQKKDFAKAYKFLSMQKDLEKDLTVEQNFEEIKKIETLYETNRLKKENELEAKEKELAKVEAQQNLILAVSIFFLAIIFALIIWYINRQRRLKEVTKKANIEQRFLRSQLNPHFLFNSLVAIQNFVMADRKKEASRYLAGFSKLMRSILEHSREELITLDEEINALTSYLELQQLRSNNKFDYEFNMSENLESEFLYLPPMLLQPVIENAIEHGFKGIQYQGLITITIKEDNDWLMISIEDNGKGRKAALNDQKLPFKKQSLATTITQERLELINEGLEHKISFEIIDLEDPTGTQVKVKIPTDLNEND